MRRIGQMVTGVALLVFLPLVCICASDSVQQSTQAELLPEGKIISHSLGEIVCLKCHLGISNYHRFAFKQQKDGRLFILLENLKLQELLDKIGHSSTKVRISGTVTRFRNFNYLLIYKYVIIKPK